MIHCSGADHALNFPQRGAQLFSRFVPFAMLLAISGILPTAAAAQEARPPAASQSPVQSTPGSTANAPAQAEATVQLMQPGGTAQSAAALTVTLADALERARKNDAQFLAAQSDARSAHEDRVQARAARLPGVNFRTDYLGTQGNGVLPSGRFVTNDGVHVYRSWGVVHEDLSANTWIGTTARRATAAEAIAQARAEIAQRGLTVTVTRSYYALVVSQRKYATAQQGLENAKRFFDLTADTERAGQAAHSDVIKAEIQYRQQQQAFEEVRLAMENARLGLAVLLFPTLNENFSAVDDLDAPRGLPGFEEVQTMAGHENPDLRVALQAQRQASLDVTAARTAFFPSLVIDTVYGIEANAFALRSTVAAAPQVGRVPNLGYFVTASLVLPVWDWGSLRSKLHQAEFRQQQSQVELSQAQRLSVSNLYNAYNEAAVARAAVDRLRHTADLATESLRLLNLRYQSGASTILEVVDAQNTLVTARNAYDDAQVRYRVAVAQLQTLTGPF
jgi:outer membrane protein TolC